jgi:hypothetical protein
MLTTPAHACRLIALISALSAAQAVADSTRLADDGYHLIAQLGTATRPRPPVLMTSGDLTQPDITYFIDCSSGNDGNDGRSASRAWRTLGRSNELAHPGGHGHLDIGVFNGPCTDEWNPANSGLSHTQRIRLIPIENVLWTRPNGNWFFQITRDYISIKTVGGNWFTTDGQCTPVYGGVSSTMSCAPAFWAFMNGARFAEVEVIHDRTKGYQGVRFESSDSQQNVFCVQWGSHGNLVRGDGLPPAYGDAFDVRDPVRSGGTFLRITGECYE